MLHQNVISMFHLSSVHFFEMSPFLVPVPVPSPLVEPRLVRGLNRLPSIVGWCMYRSSLLPLPPSTGFGSESSSTMVRRSARLGRPSTGVTSCTSSLCRKKKRKTELRHRATKRKALCLSPQWTFQHERPFMLEVIVQTGGYLCFEFFSLHCFSELNCYR